MDFTFTEEQQMLKKNVRTFLDREIVPVVDEYEKKGALTKEATVGFIRQLMPLGYLSGFLPEQYGGSELDHKTNGILVEELARAWGSLAGTVFIAAGFWWLVTVAGSPEQKERLLPRAASGDYIGCICITELMYACGLCSPVALIEKPHIPTCKLLPVINKALTKQPNRLIGPAKPLTKLLCCHQAVINYLIPLPIQEVKFTFRF